MLSRNLLIASAVVFLATIISTAPVEEKEPEETEVETEEGEEEVSEEEADDDDDSKSQDLNKGTGAQHATTVSKDLGVTPQPGISVGESSNGQKQTADGSDHTSQDASSSSSAAGGVNAEGVSDLHSLSSDPSSHASTANGGGSMLETGVAADSHSSTISHDSTSSTRGDSIPVHPQDHSHSNPPESDPHLGESQVGDHGEPFPDTSQIEAPGSSSVGSEVPEIENNGNGHKHLVGGPVTGQTGVDHFIERTTQRDSSGGVDTFGGSHRELTGMVDQANADFFIGLMGGMVDAYGPDAHTDTLDHMGLTFSLDPTAVGLDPGQPSSSSAAPDAPPVGLLDPSSFDHHGPDLSGVDHTAVDHTRLDHVSVQHAGLDYWPDAFAHTHVDVGTADHIHSSPGFTADITDPELPFDMMPHADHVIIDYPDGGADAIDSAHSNGNGRHRPVTETLRGDHPGFDVHHDSSSTAHQPITAADGLDTGDQHAVVSPLDTTAGTFEGIDHTHGPQTDMAGGPLDVGAQANGAGIDAAGGESVTNVQIQVEATAMVGIYGSSPPDTLGHEGVTDSQSRFTDSLSGQRHGITDMVDSHSLLGQTDAPVTGHPHGVSDHTGGMDSVTAGPQGTVGGSSQPGVTEQTQAAVSAGEQYNTSGQGPEGAENVELEDTC